MDMVSLKNKKKLRGRLFELFDSTDLFSGQIKKHPTRLHEIKLTGDSNTRCKLKVFDKHIKRKGNRNLGSANAQVTSHVVLINRKTKLCTMASTESMKNDAREQLKHVNGKRVPSGAPSREKQIACELKDHDPSRHCEIRLSLSQLSGVNEAPLQLMSSGQCAPHSFGVKRPLPRPSPGALH